MSIKENAVVNFVRSSFEELTKVVWPTKNQAIRLTILVMAMCLVVTFLVALFDYGLNEGYTYLLNNININQ